MIAKPWNALFDAVQRKPLANKNAGELLRQLQDTLAWTIPLKRTEFARLSKDLSAARRETLLSDVNAFRNRLGTQPLAKLDSPVLRDDLVSLAHSYALKLANHIYEVVPVNPRKRLVNDWIIGRVFRELSSFTQFADEAVDRTFGMNERKIKSLLGMPQQNLPRSYLWEDASLDRTPEDLFTPYRVIQDLLRTIKPKANTTIVDLGSGLGRLGFFLGLNYPKVNFLGLELVKERVLQSREISAELKLSPRIRFEIEDLSRPEHVLPPAEVYFLFNPFILKTLKRVFEKLRQSSSSKSMKLAIVRIGRPPRLIQREPWLTKAAESKNYAGWEGKGWALYHTRNTTLPALRRRQP